MKYLPFAVGLAVLAAGCQCQPTIPPPADEPDPPPQSTAETAQTGDTGPPKPCEVPETEPNNGLDTPNVVALETTACGTISQPLDIDYWGFSHAGSWLEIELDAADGSFINPTFLLTPVGDTWAARREDDTESVDATLRFLAPAGDYRLAVSDQGFNGGERYTYDLLISEAKPPAVWTREELEPNDEATLAEIVTGGETLYGTMSGNGAYPDYDYYVITIPSGKHTLKIDVDAFDVGSSANLTVYLRDEALDYLPEGCTNCALAGGIPGVELDPIGEYDSNGSEIVYIQVREAGSQEGPANWYVLAIELEE